MQAISDNKINANAQGASEPTIGEMVAKDFRKASVFKKYGLDFCCGGKKSLGDACAEKGLDPEIIAEELKQAEGSINTRPMPYGDWELGFLGDYITNMHHGYVRKVLPDLRAYSAKLAQVHGRRHPELITIYKLVEEVAEEMTSHMAKEEQVLFPYIKELSASRNGNSLDKPGFGTVQNPINMMEMEHEMVGQHMEEIRRLSDGYTLPGDACGTYRVFYRMLEEFETDLHIHIHLENNILFPKALDMEKEFRLNNKN